MNTIKNHKKVLLFSIFLFGIFTVIIGTTVPPDDFLMHVTFGKWIIQNKEIPSVGIGSWYAVENNITYTFHEWLAGVIDVGYEKIFGFSLGEWVQVAVHLSILVMILFLTVRNEWLSKLNFSVFWIIAGVATLGCVATARPVLYGLMFFAVEMWALEDIKYNENSKKIWIIPLLAIPWSNLHGGSVALSYAIICLYVFLELISCKAKESVMLPVHKMSVKTIKKLIFAFVLTVAGSCINPYGIKMFLYTFSHFNGHTDHAWIAEWQAITITSNPMTYLFIYYLSYCFVLSVKEKNELTDLLLLGLLALLSLKTYRYIAWFYVASNFIVWRYIEKDKKENNLKLITYAICGAVLLSFSISEVSIKGAKPTIWLSDEALETIKDLNPQRMYCTNAIGSLLLYEGYNVFFDGRGGYVFFNRCVR